MVLNPEEKEYFLSTYSNNLITEIASKRILEELYPDAVAMFSPQYSINASFAAEAQKSKIPVYYFAGNGSLAEMHRTLRIWSWEKYKCLDPALLQWDKYEISVTKSQTKRIKKHFDTISSGKSAFTYSPKNEGNSIREFFQIDQKSKIILAAMSSYDEFFASKYSGYLPPSIIDSQVFKNQTEWIKSLIAWGRENQNFTIIVRPHPREFPNKRDRIKAKANTELEIALKSVPDNFRIDHPDNNLSMDQYYKEVDAITVSWSSVAIEALYRNIPVISYDQNLVMIPKQIHISGSSIEEYWNNLSSLNSLSEINFKELTMKWFVLSNFIGGIECRNGFLQSKICERVPILRSFYYRIDSFSPKNAIRLDKWFKPTVSDVGLVETLFLGQHESLFDLESNQQSKRKSLN